MKRLLSILFAVSIALSGCTPGSIASKQKQYTDTFLNLFDTVTTISGRAASEAGFRERIQTVYDELLIYHQLFDIYHDYEGINNLKTVNDQAGIAPVKVDARIIRMLQDAKEYYALTDGRVNVAMGGVLQLWHEAREDGRNDPAGARLPEQTALEEAGAHMDIDAVLIDEEASTVYISDPEVRLDVGAVAKGWAVEQVAKAAPEDLLISVGGNVCATGPKDESGTAWVIGIQDPDESSKFLHTIYVSEGCVVTSGDYQRVYTVDGKAYHHIIDPDTLYPSKLWSSVTIVCGDSGLADALSTALFLMPLEEGLRLLENCGAEAVWVDLDGGVYYSPGFKALIRT